MYLGICRLIFIVGILGQSVLAINLIPMSEQRLSLVHHALFEAYIPFSDQEMDTTTTHLLNYAKAVSFQKIKLYPNISAALFLLDNLHLLHSRTILKLYYNVIAKDKNESHLVSRQSLKPVRDFIFGLNGRKFNLSIVDLNKKERLEFLAILNRSELNVLRQIGLYIRMFYNQALYEGRLSEKISGHLEQGNAKSDIMPTLPKFKTHLKYREDDHRIVGKLDAIIVGSGPSGSVAAHELQQKGLRVLVVEAGPLVIPGAFDTTSDTRFMEGQAPRIVEDGSVVLLNGEAVGGGTVVNLNMAFAPTMPIVRHRFHLWHEKKLIPDDLWTDHEIDQAYSWVESKFKPRTVEWNEVNHNNVALMGGAYNLSIPYKRYVLNTYKPGQSPYRLSGKKTSFDQLLKPAMMSEHNPASLLTDCRVSEVLMRHGKAYGIECVYQPNVFGVGILHDLYGFHMKPGTKITIEAKNIILAAGNLGTSTILLKSHIHNQNIGRGFVVHPLLPLMGKFSEHINADEGEPSTIFVDHFMPTDENRDMPGYLFEVGLGKMSLWSLLVPGLPKQVQENIKTIGHSAGFAVLLSDSVSEKNRVELDCHGKPKVYYHVSDNDRIRMIDGIKRGINMLFAAGAKEVSFSSFEKPLFQNSLLVSNTLKPDMDIDKVMQDFKLTPNQNMLFGGHMMGGNKLGVNPKTSVVNGNYQVWNTQGLYVIDSSIFPESMGANPMQTIYTTAKIFTERFLRNQEH